MRSKFHFEIDGNKHQHVFHGPQMFQGRSSLAMAEEFVSGLALRSQRAALWGARALLRLQASQAPQALALATRLDLPDLSIQVCNMLVCDM